MIGQEASAVGNGHLSEREGGVSHGAITVKIALSQASQVEILYGNVCSRQQLRRAASRHGPAPKEGPNLGLCKSL